MNIKKAVSKEILMQPFSFTIKKVVDDSTTSFYFQGS